MQTDMVVMVSLQLPAPRHHTHHLLPPGQALCQCLELHRILLSHTHHRLRILLVLSIHRQSRRLHHILTSDPFGTCSFWLADFLIVKRLRCFIDNPSQSYGVSPAIWDCTVSAATWHRWTCPALSSARQAGTRLTYPRGMEGWVDLDAGYIPKWFTCPQTVTHARSNQLIALSQPEVKPTTSRLVIVSLTVLLVNMVVIFSVVGA